MPPLITTTFEWTPASTYSKRRLNPRHKAFPNEEKNIVIMGAGGRDFHNFNVLFRRDPSSKVVAFTAAQIPFIEKQDIPP